jgi:hypothetical protein
MKTRRNRGFSSESHSSHFLHFCSFSCALRQNQGSKIDGASGAHSLRARRIATALFVRVSSRLLSATRLLNQTGRRGADGFSFLARRGAMQRWPGLFLPAKPCAGASA